MAKSPRPQQNASERAFKSRASITFPPEIYADLSRIAENKKVSIAWVVRDAVEKYIADQWPLFRDKP